MANSEHSDSINFIYNALLDLASTNDELHVVQVSRTDVDKWLKEWKRAPSQSASSTSFLKLETRPTTTSLALSNQTIFDFDTLDAVLTAQTHPLFALLRVFLSDGPDDLHAW
ncbi:hypothetical protein BJY52DRAFT_1194425 [Lactarius psammicola]|nr:hypothetical protein BJY52DRAFT_1194425 [Lactarius psammicola]